MKHRFRIRYKRLFLFLGFVFIIVLVGIKFLSLRISNIYVSGNLFLSDQDVIEMAGISNYPKVIVAMPSFIQKKIKTNVIVHDVNVKRKNFTKYYIDVTENKPLFYDEQAKKTILSDGNFVLDIYDVPILVNSVNSDIYDEFLVKTSAIRSDVFANISEIEYTPNDVDKELFLFTMKDGNYISVNLNKFSSIDRYLDIVKKVNNKKGILYLDSGEYFKILSN